MTSYNDDEIKNERSSDQDEDYFSMMEELEGEMDGDFMSEQLAETSLNVDQKRLAALNEVSRKILSTHDLDYLLKTVMEELRLFIPAEKGLIILKSKEGGSGRTVELKTIAKWNLEGEDLEFSRTIVREVLKTDRPYFSRDVCSDQKFSQAESIRNLQILSVICIPLKKYQGDATIGTLYIDTRTSSTGFSEQDLFFAETFANMLAIALDNSFHVHQLNMENRDLRHRVKRLDRLGELVGGSEAMQKVFRIIDKISEVKSNVLILGETGTGKEVAARTIHNLSARRNGPYVTINCGALPENLLESELFGHVRGAFTGAAFDKKGLFQAADGGSILLDEIGSMPLSLQVKTLRVLAERKIRPVGSIQEKNVDVRIIAATNENIDQMVKERSFRADLLNRLAVVTIYLPPLRERTDDIPALAQHFLKIITREFDKKIAGFAPAAFTWLNNQDWKEGNVRQLRNTVERAVIFAEKDQWITPELLIPEKKQSAPAAETDAALPENMSLREVESFHIKRVYESNNKNKEKSAKILGISKVTLYRKLKEYDIQ